MHVVPTQWLTADGGYFFSIKTQPEKQASLVLEEEHEAECYGGTGIMSHKSKAALEALNTHSEVPQVYTTASLRTLFHWLNASVQQTL